MMRTSGVVILLTLICAMLTGCGEPPVTKTELNAINDIEGIVKQGIWAIYDALYQYRADHHEFPDMIYGGDKEGWEYYNANLPECAKPYTDPLIEGGYIREYPLNPFMRTNPKYEKEGLMKYRKGIVDFQHGIGAADFDPRFGVDGDRMGNALLEPYIFVGPGTPDKPCHLRLCPGQFFYRVYGGYNVPGDLPPAIGESPAIMRKAGRNMAFFIGAFGALDTEGGDVIRFTDMNGYIPPKFPYIYDDQFYIPHVEAGNIELPLTVPEVFGGGRKSVLPTYPPWGEEYRIICGAGDGYRDGVFYVVDYTGQVVEDKKEGEKTDLSVEPIWGEGGFIDEEKEKKKGEEGETPEPKPKPSSPASRHHNPSITHALPERCRE